jgi:DNA-binding IclR family transcriptional regulator
MSQAVERAIEILEMLSLGPQHPLDVAAQLGIHRTTALRLIQDLCNGGLARKNDDGSFSVGIRLVGLAHAALEQFDLRAIAHRHLVELNSELGLTVHIATVVGDQIVYADKIEPRGTVRLYSEIGRPVRLHASGVGKAIVAFMPAAERTRLLYNYSFERFTSTTVTSPEKFVAHLAEIRSRGWSRDDGEFEPWVNCVGVPVRDSTGQVSSAISVTALRAQADLTQLERELPRIKQAATNISRDIGWDE